jgi:membrane protein
MMLLSLAIGIILARSLLQTRRSRWQQSTYLLTANTPVEEDPEDQNDDDSTTERPDTLEKDPKKP